MKKLVKEIKEAYDHEGSRFKLIEVGDTFVRFRFYSDSSGETIEMEQGYTDQNDRYSGSIGVYQRYKKRSTIKPFDWESEILKTLSDKYCAQRTPFNFFTAWFYWHLTGKAINEICDAIVISGTHHGFLRVDPDLILPKTRASMKARCIEIVPQLVKKHESKDEYFNGYYHDDDSYDRIFEHACSCNDGKRMTRRDEVTEELMSVPLDYLKKLLSLAIKEAIDNRIDEIK